MLPERSGIDQLHIGISWAPVTQRRDSTKPTWVLGFEARPSVGAVMKYDPREATANTAVGRGLHQFRFWTSIARRFPHIDTWMGFHYLLPVARSDSLFEHTRFPGSGQRFAGPRHRGWVESGVEFVPWQEPKRENRLAIELSARVEGVFEGRGYSPLWDLLAGQQVLSAPCIGSGTPPPWDNGTYCRTPGQTIPYVGITRIENHFNLFGTLALNLSLTKHFVGRIGVGLGYKQPHFITVADAGHVDCDPSRPDTCKGRLDPNDPSQANPMYRPLIEAPGRRFQVSEATVFDFFIAAMGRF